MTVKYNIIERVQPGVKGGGFRKNYAKANMTRERTLLEMSRWIESMSTVSAADVYGVIRALTDTICMYLSEGEIVRLGDFGSFRMSISSEGKDKPEEVNNSCIKSARVIFTPGYSLKKMIKHLEFEKK